MAVRTHIVLPEELIREVDEVAGPRKRSRFVEAAVREKLERDALDVVLGEIAGIVDISGYPDWSDPERISGWVRKSRSRDDDRAVRKLRELRG